MPQSEEVSTDREEPVFTKYILNVQIIETTSSDGASPQYRFEAPQHKPMMFDDSETAELYADVYFDTNGFQEDGTGERGVPPEVIQAGRDTLAAYFLTMSGTDINWVASFYGKNPTKIERYVASVRHRAKEVREKATEGSMK